MEKYDDYIKSAIKQLPKTQADFGQLKKKLSKQYGIQIPTNADLRDRYNELLKKKKPARNASHSDAGGPIINKDKVGRNDPCPCGSGKKFKKCCGK